MEIQGYLQKMTENLVMNDTGDALSKVSTNSGKEQKFQDIMDQQVKNQSGVSAKADKTEKTAYVQQVNDKRQQELQDTGNGELEVQVYEDPSVQNSLEDMSEEVVEQVSEFVSEMKQQICDTLGLSEEELEDLMTEMGLVCADLLQPVNLQNLTLKAADTEDRMVLLTNEYIGQQATDLEAQISELMADVEVSEEDLAKLLTEVENLAEVESVTQPEDVVIKEPSQVIEQSELLNEIEVEPEALEGEATKTDIDAIVEQQSGLTGKEGKTESIEAPKTLPETDASVTKEHTVGTDMDNPVTQETEPENIQKNIVGGSETEFVEKEVNEKDSMPSMLELQSSQQELPEQDLEKTDLSMQETRQQDGNRELVKEENYLAEQTLGSPKEQVGMKYANATVDVNAEEETPVENTKSVPDTEFVVETKDSEKMADYKDQAGSNSEGFKEEPKTVFQNVMEHMVQTATEQVEGVQEKVQVARQVHEIVTQVVEQIKVVVTEDTSEMVIHLNPEHLGKVNLSVVARDGHITAQFVTETELARQALESQIQQLRATLGEQGLKVDKVEVSVSDFSFTQGNSANAEEQKERQRNAHAKALHRNLNLADMNNISDMTEEELLAVDVMRRNGGQIDFTA